MKKTYLLIILFSIISLYGYSANPEKQYKKLIEKFDVADEAKNVSPNSPAEFWTAMLDNNGLLKTLSMISRKTRALKKRH